MLRDYPRLADAVLYRSYNPGTEVYVRVTRRQACGGLRENASSRSSGVSADIRSTHSAEKKSPVGASTTGTTAWVIVLS